LIDLARILRTVVATLEGSEIDYVVVGSTAAAAWGVARSTRDIDIVVVVDADQLQATSAT
jgi:tRNA nucleotidyltransferase (CCA-adding enzyme)